MPVTGLVIVLDPQRGEAAMRNIGRNQSVTLGSGGTPQRVPAVLETDDHAESRRQLKWLERQDGVAMIEVVSVDFSDVDPAPPSCLPTNP